MAILLDVLEVSKATIKRDISYMQDRLQAPIHWSLPRTCGDEPATTGYASLTFALTPYMRG